MAGIKIHNYPIERTSFGDDDYYDIDYWTGTAYETAKIKGSVLKSALGYSFVDIQAFISGYTLSANDAGKVITNSNTGAVRSLVVNNALSGAGNSFHVKGRVAIQPLTGVNIDLPDGTTITEPTQYTCEANTHYVLHRKASTGNDWVLSAINKDTLTNLALSNLEQMDLVRVFEVYEDGEFKFITNHANSDAIFRVGENSEERFGEITLNSETFNQTVAVQNPTNDGQGIITRVNPNEFDVESRDDISDVGTRRNRIYFNPQATTLEFTESGRLILRNNGVPENIFEDLSPTKKGLQYNADYSADYTDRSLVDKAFVLNNASNIGNSNLSIPSTTTRTLTIPSDSILDLGANVRIRNNAFELRSVTTGFLMNRVTTIQMNAIVGMSDNELVFNTDVKAIFRYDATLLQWVALSSGYGIIAVYIGSGSGVPTFFATLQSALETCKASGGYFTVKLYSNLTITSAIEIDYTGSGTGKAYLFRQLTIDFNGFSITNAQANTTDAFTLQLSNSASVYQNVTFLNGAVFRSNGTGTHHALKCDQTGRFGTIQMSKMLWYCQNGQTARIGLGLSTAVDADRVCDLGGSTFISNASGARTMTLPNAATTVTNFRVYHTGALDALYMDTGRAHNFYAENTSTGKAILAVGSNFIISQFDCKSNSGIALDLNGSGAEAHNFTAKSTSGEAVSVKGTAIATLFKADTGNNHALRVEGNSIAKDAFCQNNSATLAAVTATDYNRLQNIEGINLGASFGGRIQQAQALRGALRNCTFISIGGIGAEIISTTNNVNADNCNFESQLDSSSGHALRVQSISSGTFTLTKCNYTVRNSGANVLNAAAATTVRTSTTNTHNQVASTPVNANITLTTMTGF